MNSPINSIKEIYIYREMLRNLVKRELRTRYKGSVLGFLWTFVNPLLQLLVYSVVFSTIMRMDVDKYPMFLFVGLMPWLFFANTAQQSASLIIANGNLIKKVYLPREILPLANTTAQFINLALSMIIVFIALCIYEIPITMSIVALPIVMAIQFIFTLGFSLILSSITVYMRDVEHIWSIVSMAWFYLTPIIYPVKMVPSRYLDIFYMNPMTGIALAYQDILYRGIFPDFQVLLYMSGIAMGVLLVGFLLFKRLERGFAEAI